MSKAPPLGAEAEPEAHPLSVSLVSFCTSRKKLALRRNLGRTIRGALPVCRDETRHPPAKIPGIWG